MGHSACLTKRSNSFDLYVQQIVQYVRATASAAAALTDVDEFPGFVDGNNPVTFSDALAVDVVECDAVTWRDAQQVNASDFCRCIRN